MRVGENTGGIGIGDVQYNTIQYIGIGDVLYNTIQLHGVSKKQTTFIFMITSARADQFS